MQRLIEVRTYQLKSGASGEFLALMRSQAVPLLRTAGTDVVAWGRSTHEHESCFLIRAYADCADLIARQDAFYASDVWRHGPREPLVACIQTYLNTLLWLAPEGIDSMRALNASVAPEMPA
ncbi:MAG: NIPSNAP family protein [Lysobacterales bacterium]